MSKDKTKKISIQKMLVGHFIEKIPEDFNKKIAYVWQGDGIWEIRRLPLGTFTTHIQKFEVPGLESDLTEGWVLNVPKIPAVSLDVALSFFRQIYNQHSSEVFLQYFYDMEKEEYVIHCPQQTVGAASVNYIRDYEYEKNKILVFEVHSHGSMNAFFSGTDDADEKDDRFFGVIGHVKQYYPEFKIRLSMGGRKKEIQVDEIFDLESSEYYKESFPKEWVEKIKEKEVKVVSYQPPTQYPKRWRSHRGGGGVYYPNLDIEEEIAMFEASQGHTGLKDDQKLIEKNGKTYVVTDTGTEEVWEEIETKEILDHDQERKPQGILGRWRDIDW